MRNSKPNANLPMGGVRHAPVFNSGARLRLRLPFLDTKFAWEKAPMNEPVYILGAARTDFRRNLQREGKGLRDLIVEAGGAAMHDAGVDSHDVQCGVVGNFAAGLFAGQLHLGAFLTEIDARCAGCPRSTLKPRVPQAAWQC